MAQNYCGKCGNAVMPHDLYCTKCGARLGSDNREEKHTESTKPVQKQSSQFTSIPYNRLTETEKSLSNLGDGSEAKIGETKPAKFPRNAAALEFAMEPRKTMAELTAEGRAELRTCSSCHKQTPFPIDTPPCAIALICQHCGAPLMSISPELDYVRPELVSQVFGYPNRGLLHVFCPWCKEKNYAITAPANCVSSNYYVISEPQNPQALFRMQVDCVHCQKEFWLEWD